jgi:hypothetical protein
MWLQHKQKQAALAKVQLDPASVNQAAAMRHLVSTAKGVKDPLKPTFLEPVARMGAGTGVNSICASLVPPAAQQCRVATLLFCQTEQLCHDSTCKMPRSDTQEYFLHFATMGVLVCMLLSDEYLVGVVFPQV